jgi:hypothetical protein
MRLCRRSPIRRIRSTRSRRPSRRASTMARAPSESRRRLVQSDVQFRPVPADRKRRSVAAVGSDGLHRRLARRRDQRGAVLRLARCRGAEAFAALSH